MPKLSEALFSLGQVVSTPGALSAPGGGGIDANSLLGRHITGDWGEISEDDKRENDLSVTQGFRILSAYTLPHIRRSDLDHHRGRPLSDNTAPAG